MSNVRHMHCPEMHICCSVGKNGSLWAYPDRVNKFAEFLEATKGRPLIMTAEEDAHHPVIGDKLFIEFDPARDYELNPVTEQELQAAWNELRKDHPKGWAEATHEQLAAIGESVAKGKLGYIEGVTLHTDAFKK